MNSLAPLAGPWSLPIPAEPVRVTRTEAPARTKNLRRRRCKPFFVPGLEVDAVRLGWLRERPAEAYVVPEVSRGGLRMRARGLKRGHSVRLWLQEPGAREAIALRGRVVSAYADGSGWADVRVVFAPYSDKAGENSRRALTEMQLLESRWA